MRRASRAGWARALLSRPARREPAQTRRYDQGIYRLAPSSAMIMSDEAYYARQAARWRRSMIAGANRTWSRARALGVLDRDARAAISGGCMRGRRAGGTREVMPGRVGGSGDRGGAMIDELATLPAADPELDGARSSGSSDACTRRSRRLARAATRFRRAAAESDGRDTRAAISVQVRPTQKGTLRLARFALALNTDWAALSAESPYQLMHATK